MVTRPIDDVVVLYILISFLFPLWVALETVHSLVKKSNKLTVHCFFFLSPSLKYDIFCQ